MKRIDATVVEPIRRYLQEDIRSIKVGFHIRYRLDQFLTLTQDARRVLDQTQRTFDVIVSRYAGQTKSKEPSSLREDAFQLHESRKAYLKASMDFCLLAPQVRGSLDKLLVKIFAEQWREMKSSREVSYSAFSRWNGDIDRVRGWSREMENGERVFKRELQLARKQIEDSAETATRPSRELDDYSASTVPYLSTSTSSTANLHSPAKPLSNKSEMQGWLFQKTLTGKPARSVWLRRWYYVKNGIFGWLAQGGRLNAVEESEKIGVLLCSIRPAFQEERRFCFEVKTKDTTIVLQAETQQELVEWISAFEVAKRHALEDPSSTDNSANSPQVLDAAFAISPPVAPEFAARVVEGHTSHASDDLLGVERATTMNPESMGSLATRGSFDVSRRATGMDREGESGRDHATRIIQKLDLHRKSTAEARLSNNPSSAGGIASLISASHSILPVGTASPQATTSPDTRISLAHNLPTSSLAPSTLVNPPAPTNLSKAAVTVSGERGIGLGRVDGGMPSGLMANLWGSRNWGYVNRLESEKPDRLAADLAAPIPPPAALSPEETPQTPAENAKASLSTPNLGASHRKTISLGAELSRPPQPAVTVDAFPNYYPLPLKVQDAQFRILFPNAPRGEKVVLVFRAVWNPTDQQEFPGRIYVTANELYFYSNHMGLVLITGIRLSSIDEITAAPGKDCDFLYLHFKEGATQDGSRRVTIKIFLEPLKLLQRRLSFLVRNTNSDSPLGLEDIIKRLIKMEADDGANSPSAESWEDVSISTPVDGGPSRQENDLKTSLRIDGNLFGGPVPISKNATKFKLPSQPVAYAPQGMTQKVVDKDFNVSAKALFHVLFGDKSAVFQAMYRERAAQRIHQTPWIQPDRAPHRREFAYEIAGSRYTDYQVIEVLNDHLCYEVLDTKSAWYLPSSNNLKLVCKIVITHVAKSRCKFAIYTKVDWLKDPFLGKGKNTPTNHTKQMLTTLGFIERQALQDLQLSALDLVDYVTDQVTKLGSNSRTRKAISIFGYIGQTTQATEFSISDLPPPTLPRKFALKQRTLFGMYLQAIRVTLTSLFLSSIEWVGSSLTALLKIFTAHAVLIGLLLLSATFNALYVQRETLSWWNERAAGKFMSRIGVGPSPVMSRAIYLHDLDTLSNYTAFPTDSEKKW